MFLSKLIKKLRVARVNENASSKKKVIVVGASGYVGKATLAALTCRHSNTVFAGVRNPEKFDTMEKVTTLAADMKDKARLTETLRGFDSVFLVVPGPSLDRTQLAINGWTRSCQGCRSQLCPYCICLDVWYGFHLRETIRAN